METTPDQACENDNNYTQSTPKENSSKDNPCKSLKILGPFSRATLALLISYLAFLYFSDPPISFSLSNQQKSDIEVYLNQITGLSIEIDRKIIQASSLKEQTFPLLVSRTFQDLQPPFSASVDLICVFDMSKISHHAHSGLTYHVKDFFQKVFPLMNGQDRLSVVLLDGLKPEGPILGILPFMNMTKENQEKTLSSLLSLALNMARDQLSMIEDPVNILNQRNGTSQATGIFLFSEEDSENLSEDFYKKRLGLQGVRKITKSVMDGHTKMIEDFTNGLNALRNYVAETIFSIKPEESQFFKGIEIIDNYIETSPDCEYNLPWWQNNDGTFGTNSSWVKLGHHDTFIFDLKIPKIPYDLLESPMEVKIASLQQIYILLDGTQVIKNSDLVVKIVKEGEKFLNEDNRGEGYVKYFYENWERRLSWMAHEGVIYGRGRGSEMLRRFKESVDNSIVKNDEEMRWLMENLEESLT